MAEHEDVFRFLDLPAELRNRIYTHASTKPDSDECCVLPCLSLAQVNHQIRAGYLPICMKVPVTIAWRDLPDYINHFYPTVKGQLQNVEQAPSTITIIADYSDKGGRSFTDIDILPLIKIRQAHVTFHCRFVNLIPEDKIDEDPLVDPRDWEHDYASRWLATDSQLVLGLINHTHDQWLEDASAGTIDKILVNRVGLYMQITADIYVYLDEVPEPLERIRWIKPYAGGIDEPEYLDARGLNCFWDTGLEAKPIAMDDEVFYMSLYVHR